jgi:acetyl esterase/lipase
MKTLFVTALLLVSLMIARAQMQNPIPLWPDGAPGALGTSSNDIPTLTPFLCESNATGAALVICPGGGYAHLAPHEGEGFARWLSGHGVTCFVLKYRLGLNGYRHPAMLNDAARAVRWVRANAAQYQIDVHRVGIMGSSAGGHLASTLMTHFDAGDAGSPDPIERQSSRPDLGVLCYAVITMGEFTHGGSKQYLLGTNPPPSPELVKLLSNETQVTTNTPTCFLWTTFEDKTVPMENTLMFAEALRRNHVPFDLHVYQKGGHGMGLGDKKHPSTPAHLWAADCLFWLQQHDFAK